MSHLHLCAAMNDALCLLKSPGQRIGWVLEGEGGLPRCLSGEESTHNAGEARPTP